MPFQYQPRVNPYVGSITDLMGRGTEARSRAELSAAEAEAKGQLRLGDISQKKWSGLGQTIGQGIDDYVTEQREAPLRELKLGALQRDAAIQQALGEVAKGSIAADGTVDWDASKALAQRLLAPYPEELAEWIERHTSMRQASQPTIGDPEEYMVNGVPTLVRERVLPDGTRSHVDMQGQPIDGKIVGMPGKQERVMRRNADGEMVPTWIPEGTASGDDVRIPDPLAAARPPPTQKTTFRLMNADGTWRDVQGEYRPDVTGKTGGVYLFEGKDVTGRAMRIPPGTPVGTAGSMEGPAGSYLRGEQFLETLPPDQAGIVRAIADYMVDLTKVTSLRTGRGGVSARERMAQLVLQYDPTYDQTQFTARSRTRLDFSSGKAANNIRSLNTAVHHVVTLSEKIENLENAAEGDFSIFTQLYNTVKNKFYTESGDPRITEFGIAANAVESELASLFKGTGATDQEIKAWREQLHSSQSVEQLQGAIITALNLLEGRLSALDKQWVSNMHKPRDFRILSDSSRALLEMMGIDAEAFDPVAPPPTAIEDDEWLEEVLGQ
jgi:hypothetical protein